MSLLRKSLKRLRYRKYGTSERIQTYINNYLNPDSNLKIENLLTTPFDFTHAAVVDYLKNNRHMYLEYGHETVINDAFMRLCRAYEEEEYEPFFRIVRGDIFESKYEKASFRKIKCIWVFYELLRILKDKKNKGIQKVDILDFFENKVDRLKVALKECKKIKIDTPISLYTPVSLESLLGVMDFELMIIEHPFQQLSSFSKTRKNSSRSNLKR